MLLYPFRSIGLSLFLAPSVFPWLSSSVDAASRRQARALAAIRPISVNRLLNRDFAKQWLCTPGGCHMQGQIACSTLNFWLVQMDRSGCGLNVGMPRISPSTRGIFQDRGSRSINEDIMLCYYIQSPTKSPPTRSHNTSTVMEVLGGNTCLK